MKLLEKLQSNLLDETEMVWDSPEGCYSPLSGRLRGFAGDREEQKFCGMA